MSRAEQSFGLVNELMRGRRYEARSAAIFALRARRDQHLIGRGKLPRECDGLSDVPRGTFGIAQGDAGRHDFGKRSRQMVWQPISIEARKVRGGSDQRGSALVIH
jgi:hypothetical protein